MTTKIGTVITCMIALILMTFQFGSDLSAWTDVVIGAGSSGPDPNGVEITVEENAANLDLIQITLPVGVEGRVFGRIRLSAMP